MAILRDSTTFGDNISFRRYFMTYVEAGAGIEPANRGFADLGLTTWLPRRMRVGTVVRN